MSSSATFSGDRDDEGFFQSELLPVLPLRDIVVFPYMVTPLLVGRSHSVAAVEAAMERGKTLVVIAQKEPEIENPKASDLFRVGTVIKVLQIIRTPDDTLKILVEGVSRVLVQEMKNADGFLEVTVDEIEEISASGTEIEALSRSIKERFKEYVRLNKRLPDEVLLSVLNLDEIGRMTDSISAYILGKVPLKQELLEEPSLELRLR
ncbi:MAG: ATP-dependent Lon protease, partial [Candidatus Krumholzibacteriia bacterium]